VVGGSGVAVGSTIAVQLPAGIWDMYQVEWTSFVAPYAQVGAGGVRVEILDGCSFTNLRKIGGELNIFNLNNLPSRSPVVATQNAIFEFGMGPMGDRPVITNTGTTAFFDMSAMAVGQQFTIRSCGTMTGPNACVEMGASPAQLNMNFDSESKLPTGCVRGTNIAALVNVAQRHGLVEVGQQNTLASPFAGSWNYGRQLTANGPQIDRRLWTTIPATPQASATANQGIPVPLTAPITTALLGHNHAVEFVSAGVIDQVLPKIRDLRIANGLVAATTPGALNSTGMETSFKQRGAGSIRLFGESPIAAQNVVATLVNTAGGAFVVAGTTVTFTAISALFTAAMDKRAITIAGATSPANNGTFIMTFVSSTVVTWENTTPGVPEALVGPGGTWRVGDTIDGLAATVTVPAGGARTLLSDGVSNWRVIAGYL
jgi:hypothetical protein